MPSSVKTPVCGTVQQLGHGAICTIKLMNAQNRHLGIYSDTTLAENDAFIDKQWRPTYICQNTAQ